MNYQQRQIDRAVFRAYDIRGVIGEQLDEDAFYTIGRALSVRLQRLNRQQIFLARDGRLSSEHLAQALQQGLLDSGIKVINLGAVATPVMYYATHTQSTDCGLMVTGSHNPADYNGIKIVLAGKTLVQEDINCLYTVVCEQKYLDGKGLIETLDILPAYMQRIVKDINLKRPFKVVVDGGNGIAGPVIPAVLSQLGCDVIPIFCEVDGHFPNHHPDPSVQENLKDLQTRVLLEKADIGLAFDGDADRLGVITNQGEIIWPDRLMMFYAKHLLEKNPGSTIVFDVKCSSHLEQVITQAGGIAKMCPTGHSIVKGVMKECNAILAGEMSGHLFFKERWYGFDDALYSACRLLEMLSEHPQTVSEQFALISNSVNTPEIKIPIAEADKFSFMQRFSEQATFLGANVVTIDGLRVEYEYGWGLIRASNTTPCLVARFEAIDQVSLEAIQAVFKREINKVDPYLLVGY